MIEHISFGGPCPDTEGQSSLYELLKGGCKQYQIEITEYLFDDCWKNHVQWVDLFALIKDKDWQNGYAVSYSDFILLGKVLELNVNKLIKEEMPKMEGKRLSELALIISDALSNQCEIITPTISISYDIKLCLCLRFSSPSQMTHFLQKSHKTVFWRALEQCRYEKHFDLQIEAEQLQILKNVLQYIKRSDLGVKNNHLVTKSSSQTSQEIALQEVNNRLQHGDVLSLKTYWDCQMLTFLHFLHQNWTMYRHCYKQQLTNFVILNLMRSFKLSTKECRSGLRTLKSIDLYQAIYPGMNQIVQRFRLLLGINLKEVENIKNSNEGIFAQAKAKAGENHGQNTLSSPQAQKLLRKLLIEETLTDRLFKLFIDKQRKEAGYKTSLDIHVLNRETAKLKELISHCLQFYKGMSRWSDLFSTASHYFKGKHNQISKPNHEDDHFLQNIEQQPLPNMRCLGCCPFFYYKSNIYCQSPYQPVVRVLPSIRKLKEDEAAVKDEICGMLNSGGGLIFFDCERSYRQILALGQKISQKEKQQIQQRIQSYIRHFYPKIQLQSQVCVSFVPLVYRSDSKGSKENYTGKASYLKQAYTYKKHQYLQSVFVTRIKVVSLNPSIVYFWQVMPTLQNKDIEYRRYCQVSSQTGEKMLLSSKGMLKLIKQRMRRFYIIEKYSQEEDRRLLKNKASLLDHDCDTPDIGSLSLKVTHPQHQQKPVTYQQKYGQMCLIAARHKSFPRIQQLLNTNGIPCQIVYHFQAYRFAKLANTGVIYHNCRFQDIARELQQSYYKVSNKLPLVINVTPYLKLQDRKDKNSLTLNDFRSYCKAFFNEFPNQFIKAFVFITDNNQKEYYLTTESKLSTVFMYFFLNNYNQTTKLKNPPKLDRMGEEERAARFQLLFSNDNGRVN